MTIDELEQIMVKIQAGYIGMGDVEFSYASKLYEAARNYRDAAKLVRDKCIEIEGKEDETT